MQHLHPHLIGFLEGLCAASVTLYPEYGMYLRGPDFGPDIQAQPTAPESASTELLQRFFLCALAGTSASRPSEANYVVDRFLALLQKYHPEASLHCEVSETRGWFDGLAVWLTAPDWVAYFYLDWSVS